jgi:hypothetical protein
MKTVRIIGGKVELCDDNGSPIKTIGNDDITGACTVIESSACFGIHPF